MDKQAIVLTAPDPRKHAEPMIDLVAKSFGGYYRFRDYCWRAYIFHSNYDWGVSRIGLLDGRVVTHWGVWGYSMRIGSALVKAGGIGAVATDADCRKQGLMARTAAASIEAMREAGYDFSLLFGIDDFYYRFGYTRSWSDTAYIVKTSDLPKEKPSVRVRKFATRHREDIARIYTREHAGMTGTAVRPTYLAQASPGHHQGYLWTDARGRTAGYVLAAPAGAFFDCVETGGDLEQALRVVARLARKAGLAEVRFLTFPYASPMARWLRSWNCRAETIHRRRGGGMVRTINLPAALGKMAGELSQRLRASAMADWRGTLLVADAREKAVLAIGRGKVRLVPAGQSRHTLRGGNEIAQLLIGSTDPGEIIEGAAIRTTGDARKLAAALFPNQHPQLCTWDRY